MCVSDVWWLWGDVVMDDFVVVLQILEIEWNFAVCGSNGINGVEVSI